MIPPTYPLRKLFDDFDGSILELRNALSQWGCPEPERTAFGVHVDARTMFGLTLIATIRKLRWLTDTQRQYLITAVVAAAKHRTDRLDKIHEVQFVLALMDGRYVVWSGGEGCLDLQTGDTVMAHPQPFESIAYNLHVRFQRLTCGDGKDANPTTAQGRLDE